MTYTAQPSKALGIRRSAARRARGVLAATVVAAALVVPTLAAGMVAPPAHASTTFTVNSTSDLGDPVTDDGQCVIPDFSGVDHCTLRAAIQNANGTTGADVINFDIPGTGVQTINVNSQGSGPLPAITDQVTINGYTQPGSSPNTKAVGDDASLKVELDGTKVPGGSGLEISGASGSVIRGLAINRFNAGIDVHGVSSVGNRIEGNFIGTDPTGTLDRGTFNNGVIITGGPAKTVVGGSTPDKRNVISANGLAGVLVGSAEGNLIKGNYLGTDKSGTKALGDQPNGIALQFFSDGTTVGGTAAGSGNVVSGNSGDGLRVVGSQDVRVVGNRIGTTASGTGALGNGGDGLAIAASSGTVVGDGTAEGSNTIAFNAKDGVQVEDPSLAAATGNEVSRDSIFSNGGLGMDLIGPGETADTDVSNANDAGDVDPGPNGLQNRPSVGSAKTVSGTTTLKGTLSSEAGKSYKIAFYSNPSGNEGKKFMGTKSVTTGADGKAAFTFIPAAAASVGQAITATATNTITHDTSEFSAPRTVASS